MSELISGSEEESCPVLTLEEQLAKCRYSFKYPIDVQINSSGIKLIYENGAGAKSGIVLKIPEPMQAEVFVEVFLNAVEALTNMIDEKKGFNE